MGDIVPHKPSWLREIDNAKANGYSVGIIISAALFILTRTIIAADWLFALSFAATWFLCLGCFIIPHAKKIESSLFSVKSVILKRFIVIVVKGGAFFMAVTAGLGSLAYWANDKV